MQLRGGSAVSLSTDERVTERLRVQGSRLGLTWFEVKKKLFLYALRHEPAFIILEIPDII